jgi:creatinine amidohydrolase
MLRSVLLKLAIWQDVQEYLDKRSDVVIPVGSTEQHGPSGPLGTDLIAAEELANELGEERHCFVAPPLPFAASGAFGAFPGTIAVKPQTMLAIVGDLVSGLAAQGFRRFLFINAHAGSRAILQAACAQAHADVPDARCVAVQWWELPEVRSILLEMFGAREGHHATPGELSLVRKFYPRSVVELPPMDRFEPLLHPALWGAQDVLQRYPDGRIGSDPSLASGIAGDRIFVAASRALVEVHRRLVEDP